MERRRVPSGASGALPGARGTTGEAGVGGETSGELSGELSGEPTEEPGDELSGELG